MSQHVENVQGKKGEDVQLNYNASVDYLNYESADWNTVSKLHTLKNKKIVCTADFLFDGYDININNL